MAGVLANINKINTETTLEIKRKMEVEEHKWRMLYLCIMLGLVGSFSLLIVSNLHQTTVLFRSLWKRNSEAHLITALHLVVWLSDMNWINHNYSSQKKRNKKVNKEKLLAIKRKIYYKKDDDVNIIIAPLFWWQVTHFIHNHINFKLCYQTINIHSLL